MLEIAIVAVICVTVFATIGGAFLYVSGLTRSRRGSALLAWTAMVGGIYVGVLLLWIALLRAGLVGVTSPWFWLGSLGPLVLWSLAAVADALGRRGQKAAPSAKR